MSESYMEMHTPTSLTAILPPHPAQHVLYSSPPNTYWSTDNHPQQQQQQQEQQQQQLKEEIKEVDMKPLDLSLRAPRQDTTWSRPSTSSTRSQQRLSPYPILTPSSGSSRHLGSPCLVQSRSPLTRSISPYNLYHRQSPSPYYNCLPGSCTPPDNCSSLQVLSSTNRLLNALSSVSTSQLRSFENASPQDLIICESRLKESNPSSRHSDTKVDVEVEEPTYIDMDSSTTVKPVYSRLHSNHGTSSSSGYTATEMSHDVSNQTPTSRDQSNHTVTSHDLSNFHRNQSASSSFIDYPQALKPEKRDVAVSSCTSFSSLPPSSSSSWFPLPSLPTSHAMHLCDSSHSDNANTSQSDGNRTCNTYTSYNNSHEKMISTSAGHLKEVPTSTLAINPYLDCVRNIHDIRAYHNPHQQQQQQEPHQQQSTSGQDLDSQQDHQNPDSSSSPANLDSSSTSSSWMATSTACLTSPGSSSNSSINSNNSITSQQRLHSQMSPDSNDTPRSSASFKNPSNINKGKLNSATPGGIPNPKADGTGMARRSFFQIDKSLLEENSGNALFADSVENDASGRCNVLDFWISKILMEETPRRRCGADIRQTVDGNKRIRLRLVDLIELQVEQSLKA